MDKRKLVLGIGILLIIVGVLLALFTPGGILNRADNATVTTPFGTLTVREEQRSRAGPIIGYALLGIGGLGLVVAFAMKRPGA